MPSRKGQTFGPTQRLERQYAAAINKIVKRILPPIKPEENLQDWLQSIAERSQHADVQEASNFLARQMTFWVSTKNMRTWREAAAKSQKSRELYRLLQHEMAGSVGLTVQRLIQDNAKYISSVSLVAAQTLVDEVTKAQQAGARASTIAKMMKARFPQLLKSRVMLISRTETAKASTALTQARCEELSLDWYVWKTSEDQRVRESHRKMDGVLCSWADPPDPEALVGVKSGLGHYAAGSCPNCRCVIMPLLSIDDIGWPHRVYSNGGIHTLTKTQFKQRFSTKGIEGAA